SLRVADRVAAARLLDLDDVRAEIAEEGRCPGPGGLVAEVEHRDPGERRRAGAVRGVAVARGLLPIAVFHVLTLARRRAPRGRSPEGVLPARIHRPRRCSPDPPYAASRRVA